MVFRVHHDQQKIISILQWIHDDRFSVQVSTATASPLPFPCSSQARAMHGAQLLPLRVACLHLRGNFSESFVLARTERLLQHLPLRLDRPGGGRSAVFGESSSPRRGERTVRGVDSRRENHMCSVPCRAACLPFGSEPTRLDSLARVNVNEAASASASRARACDLPLPRRAGRSRTCLARGDDGRSVRFVETLRARQAVSQSRFFS